MSTIPFTRARSEEQRAERREVILATAAGMLQTTRVKDLTLNELSRRIGLAKSNVLRYFESREAVLLELYEREYTGWLDELEARLGMTERLDLEAIAAIMADTITERPVLSDLAASAPGVLEHNVSADVAARYKRGSLANAQRLGRIVLPLVADLPERTGLEFAGTVSIAIGGVWSMTQPSPGMIAAYEKHADLAAMRLDQCATLRDLLATLLVGIVARAALRG